MAEENSIVARLFKKGSALESKMRAWAVCFNLDFSWSQAGLQVWVTLWGTCWRLHWANFLFCSLSQDNPCSLVPVDNWEVRFGLGKSTVKGKVGWEETTQISEGLERFQSSRKKWKKNAVGVGRCSSLGSTRIPPLLLQGLPSQLPLVSLPGCKYGNVLLPTCAHTQRHTHLYT